MKAGREDYDFLKSIGVQIRPKNDDKNLTGIRGVVLSTGMWIIAKTNLGDRIKISQHSQLWQNESEQGLAGE